MIVENNYYHGLQAMIFSVYVNGYERVIVLFEKKALCIGKKYLLRLPDCLAKIIFYPYFCFLYQLLRYGNNELLYSVRVGRPGEADY